MAGAVIPRQMWQNFIQLSNTLIFATSEQINFPRTWLRDPLRSKRWRSEMGWEIAVGYNDKFDFQEGASPRVATLTAGTYETGDEVAAELTAAMNGAPSVINTYGVVYDGVTNKHSIVRSTGASAYDLLLDSGANKATSCAIDFGFDVSADKTGLTTYVADFVSYQSRQIIWFDMGTAFEVKTGIILDTNLGVGDSIAIFGNGTGIVPSSFVPPAFEQALIYNSTEELFAATFPGESYRWWAFELNGVQNVDGFTEVGVPFVGNYSQQSMGYGVNYTEGRQELSNIEVADQGAHFQNLRPTRRQYSIQWAAMPTVDKMDFQNIFDFVKTGRPFFFSLDAGTDETNIIYVFFAGGTPPFSSVPVGNWSASMSLSEALG